MSLSHSGELVAVTLVLTVPSRHDGGAGIGSSAAARVGVDVELCRARRDGIEHLVCTPEEAADDAVEPDPGCALMTRWTRKEAVLKALGVGPVVPMPHVTVYAASQPPRVVAVGDHPGLAGLAPASAHLTDLAHPLLADEYHASVCIVGAATTVVVHGPDGALLRNAGTPGPRAPCATSPPTAAGRASPAGC